MSGLPLAFLALIAALSGVALFVKLVREVKVDEKRWLTNTLLASGAVLAIVALTREPGVVGGVVAGVVLVVAAAFFGLLALAGQSEQEPAIRVGEPFLDFTAPDHNGEPFTLSSLAGKPILMKFFRGHW